MHFQAFPLVFPILMFGDQRLPFGRGEVAQRFTAFQLMLGVTIVSAGQELIGFIDTGAMLPMIAGSLPDFGSEFEKYAADLKREAERGG